MITKQTLVGVAIGVGITAAGHYLYRKNRSAIDNYLRAHGLDIPVDESKPISAMTLEELSILKEKLEDAIAECEIKAVEAEQAACQDEKKSPKPAPKKRKIAAKRKSAAKNTPAEA